MELSARTRDEVGDIARMRCRLAGLEGVVSCLKFEGRMYQDIGAIPYLYKQRLILRSYRLRGS